MVIQQIARPPQPVYRVVVYGDEQNSRHADFCGEQSLLETLRAAVPNFDVSKLSLYPLGEGQGSIVFVGETKLNESQLSILGLS
jgi:hypothetical protein